jgi:hypothetical protein
MHSPLSDFVPAFDLSVRFAVGYIMPKDMLASRQEEIQAERDRKLEAGTQQRQIRRQQAA